MESPKEIVAYYIGEYKAGNCEDAAYGLAETDFGSEVVPELIDAYESTDDIELKSFIIEVVSGFQHPETIGFLRHALRRNEKPIWKSALDGLATLDSFESVDSMDLVFHVTKDEEKKDWIREAISDASVKIPNQAEQDDG